MVEKYKILVVEDELTNAILMKRLLIKVGYEVVTANNGLEALKLLERYQFDLILTDWMMPQIDGIELIRQIREKIKPLPYLVMVTALVSEGAKQYALESGADDYLAKPIDTEALKNCVSDGLNKTRQKDHSSLKKDIKDDINSELPKSVGVVIATSTGGPTTLIEVMKEIPTNSNASFFVVQHGPPWMLETFSQRLDRESQLSVSLAEDGNTPEVGQVYVSPGDKHLVIKKDGSMELNNGPKENFVRPAADPLFRSAAKYFSKYLVGVVLTGLGKDAANGSRFIQSSGGRLIVQDPESCIAPSMPKAAIAATKNQNILKPDDIASKVSELVFKLNADLRKTSK